MAGLLSGAKTTLNASVPGLPLGDILLGAIGEFRRGFVFEIIDTGSEGNDREEVRTKSLVLNPRRYTLTEPFAVTLTPTEDDSVVAEENGIIIREIVIEGTTGLKKRKEEALSRGASIGTEATGPDHFFDLRNLFREYGELKKDPERGPRIQMIFHNVKEDDHYVVIPRAFETPRDAATNRMHFNYRITLAAIQPYPLPSPRNPFTLGIEALSTLQKVSEAVNVARSTLVEAIDLLDIYAQRIRDPEQAFEDAALSINSAHDFVDGVNRDVALGREFFAATADVWEALQEDMENDIDGAPTDEEFEEARRAREMRAALEAILREESVFSAPLGSDVASPFAGDRNLTDADLRDGTAGAQRGSRTRLVLGGANRSGLELGAFGSSRLDTLKAGDTIDVVAAKAAVPRDAIILLNDLRYPYITEGGGPGTLRPGDDILIPVRSAGGGSAADPSGGYLTPDDILYGVDMALDPILAESGVFDFLIDETHGALDVDHVRGTDNVVQGAQILIGTERGTTTFIFDLGIRRTPGIKGTLANMLLASLYLREAILGDPRITRIDSTRIVLQNDVLSLEMSPVLLSDREGVTITVPFGKASQ